MSMFLDTNIDLDRVLSIREADTPLRISSGDRSPSVSASSRHRFRVVSCASAPMSVSGRASIARSRKGRNRRAKARRSSIRRVSR